MSRTLLLILAVACLVGCDAQRDDEALLLHWSDPETNTTFRVTENPTLAKRNSRLHVEQAGSERTILIDDDAIFSTVAFVRHDRWLLIVCRGPDEVWAGYDYETRELFGEYDWEVLPFTKWSGQGKVVAERTLRDQSASPANYPRPSGGGN